MLNAVHETSAVTAWPHIARLVNSVGVNLVEAHIRPVAVIVVLEKGQCDPHEIEIKIPARTSISISSLTL
jgi:hypothetical protein